MYQPVLIDYTCSRPMLNLLTLLNSMAGVSTLRVQVSCCIEDLPKSHATDHIKGLTLHSHQSPHQCSQRLGKVPHCLLSLTENRSGGYRCDPPTRTLTPICTSVARDRQIGRMSALHVCRYHTVKASPVRRRQCSLPLQVPFASECLQAPVRSWPLLDTHSCTTRPMTCRLRFGMSVCNAWCFYLKPVQTF